MKRLLIPIIGLPPFAWGLGQLAWGLANALADKYEVHFLTSHRGSLTSTKQVAVHLVPQYPLMTITYSTILRPIISNLVSHISPDIIHSHITLPYGYVFRSERRKKTVVTVSGSDVYPRKAYPWKFFLDSALHDSTAVVSNSKWLAKYVEENYGIRPVVIPSGIDTGVFRPVDDSTSRKVVLFVGRFIEIKGVLELVKAAAMLPEYEFWFLGSGPLAIPALPNVKILGFHNNTVAGYARASLCVFPSHYENFPTVGLEAMACGRAVVATERGFSEYIENGKDGILVKPHDVGSLIDSIRYLMENVEARRRMEQNARQKAVQYDWTVIAKKYEAFYEKL
jgi:glycosyltransferase involved in cell wall biosynthesis